MNAAQVRIIARYLEHEPCGGHGSLRTPDGEQLMSYSIPIAIRIAEDLYLVDNMPYSRTTARHIGLLRRQLNDEASVLMTFCWTDKLHPHNYMELILHLEESLAEQNRKMYIAVRKSQHDRAKADAEEIAESLRKLRKNEREIEEFNRRMRYGTA